jgi:hypothetical protein
MTVNYPGFAGGDRTDLRLPATQRALLEALHATGKPVVVVLTGGSALAVEWAQEEACDFLLVETAGLGLAALSASDEIDWCEADGPWTDEPLIHVPLLLHPQPRAVMLFQPAGDGAAVEVLRHREVERLFLVEEERRPGLRSRQLPDDPRLVRVDPVEQLGELGLADVIVLPSPQALPPATLSAAAAHLRPGGLLAFRVPFPEVGAARRYAEHRPTFYWQHTPSRGRAVFAICGALPRLPVERDVAARMVSRGLVGLRVVSAATLPAMFALPPLLRAELEL